MSAMEWTGIIIMRINNFWYLLKEGIRGIFLHSFMSFAAVCVTVACLLIVGTFSVVMYNLNLMVENMNQTNEILVYIDSDYSDAKALSVGTSINRIENVGNAVFVSREEALKKFVADHDDDPAFSGVEPEDLRHRFVVTLEDNGKMLETKNMLENIEGVAKVQASYEMAQGFSTVQQIVRMATLVVTGVLLVVSLLIISNTVKLAMYDRKDEIFIMKMVGATNGFIRLPFVVEGFLLGIIAAVMAFFMEWWLYDSAVAQIVSMDTLRLFSFCSFREMLMPMVYVFGAAGLFVGIVGSYTSIRKFMNA